MQVLGARIQASTSDLFTPDQKTAWTTEFEARRQSYQDAIDAHSPTAAAAMLGRFGYRGAVRTALARLRDFKCDLQTLGLDEAAIHDIIPDGSRPSEPNAPAPPVTTTQPVGRAA